MTPKDSLVLQQLLFQSILLILNGSSLPVQLQSHIIYYIKSGEAFEMTIAQLASYQLKTFKEVFIFSLLLKLQFHMIGHLIMCQKSAKNSTLMYFLIGMHIIQLYSQFYIQNRLYMNVYLTQCIYSDYNTQISYSAVI